MTMIALRISDFYHPSNIRYSTLSTAESTDKGKSNTWPGVMKVCDNRLDCLCVCMQEDSAHFNIAL